MNSNPRQTNNSTDWLQLAAEAQPGYCWMVDRDLNIRAIGGCGLNANGVLAEKTYGKPLKDFQGLADDGDALLDAHRLALSGKRYSGECTLFGEPCHYSLLPLVASSDEPIGVQASVTPIALAGSFAELAERSCHDLIDKYALGLNYIVGGPRDLSQFYVFHISESITELLGLTREEVFDKPTLLLEAIHPDDRSEYYHLAMKSTDNLTDFRIVMRTNPALTEERSLLFRSRPVLLNENDVIYVGMAIDVTDLVDEAKRAKQELFDTRRQSMERIRRGWRANEQLVDFVADSERSQDALKEERRSLKSLAYQLEEDRSRLAFDLHDTVMPQLAGAQLMLQALAGQLNGIGEEITEQIHLTQNMVSNALREGRQLMHRLHPIVLKELGLFRGLDTIKAEYERQFNIEIQIEVNVSFSRLDPALETQLYRIAQSALANVFKHAEVSVAKVKVIEDGPNVEMSISDQGKGFDVDATFPNSYGLRSMRERCIACGGELRIDSEVGKGTTITACVPRDISSEEN